MAATKKLPFWLASSLVLIQNTFAEKMLPKTWKTKFLLNFYDQDSKNGAQVFDGSKEEGVTVLEPMLFVAFQVDETTNLAAHVVFDTWTAESDTILDEKTGQSGPGRTNQSRTSGNFSYSKEIGKSTWTPSLGFSSEYDYTSINGGLNWTGLFAEDNFTLSIGAHIFRDQNKLFDYDKEVTKEGQDKNVYAYDISGSQLITANDIFTFGFTYIQQSGALESIRNTVDVNGTRVVEELPDDKNRYALSAGWIHGFSDTFAWGVKYRYYSDDWDLTAHTLENSLRFSLQEDEGFLELNYRYHDQDKVKYFARSFNTTPKFRTSDSDMEDFNSHRVGVHYSYDFSEKEYKWVTFEKFEMSLGAYHYWRSNKLKANTVQASLGVEF